MSQKFNTYIDQIKDPKLRETYISSSVMAFAGMGDIMIYPILPVYGKEMGFSAFVIGLLLSINRFVRILANTHVANIVNKVGMKKVLVACSGLAVITTIFYGLGFGIATFFLARVVWGLCYSGLKISTLNYAAQVEYQTGFAFGVFTGIKSLGGLFALWLCPILIAAIGVENGFFTLAGIGIIGIALAFGLTDFNTSSTEDNVRSKKTFQPNAFNLLVFFLSLAIDGILVVALASLLVDRYPDTVELLAMVAFYLLLKRLFIFGLSLLGAALTFKFSPEMLFNCAIVFCLLALVLIASGLLFAGIVLAFLFNTLVVTFSPLVAINLQSGKRNSLQAISSVSTWWDLGAAIGALGGIFLVEKLGYIYLFSLLAALIGILFIHYLNRYGKTSRIAV